MSIRFRTAEPADYPAIAALWQEAFGDPEAAVSDFFAAFPRCISYVAEANGSVVSMVHALPQVLKPEGPAAYLYAVATRSDCRGRGLCRSLLAFAERDLLARGFLWAVLTPGEPELFQFYERLGYRTAFYRSRNPLPGGAPVSPEEYLRLRENLLTGPHMVYDLPTLEYAQRVYDLTFYRTAYGCAAAGPANTAEVLPDDLDGPPFAMARRLDGGPGELHGYLGFALE